MDLKRYEKDDLVWYQGDLFDDAVVHGFSTRLGGVSKGNFESLNMVASRGDNPKHVEENYRRFCQAVGFEGEQFSRNIQTHGKTVYKVSSGRTLDAFVDPTRTFPPGDSLVTNVPGVSLWTYFADCVPLLFYDPVEKVIGAAHAGWRGTVAGIAFETVRTMIKGYGCKSSNIRVTMGPSIGECCFLCDDDVVDAVKLMLGDDAKQYLSKDILNPSKQKVDLRGVNEWWLNRANVTQILSDVPCTSCNLDEFWSHRATGEERGSLAGMIALK